MKVTIEGSSVTRSTYLAPGKRVTVERTALINKLIKGGYVNVVAVEPKPTVPDPVPVQETMAEVELASEEAAEPARLERQFTTAPSKAASRSDWAEFLDGQNVFYPEGSTRSELITRWETVGG